MARLFISGPAIRLPRANVDTDLIIPARFMKGLDRTGLGEGAFAALRQDSDNPFDDPLHAGAPILISGANFGCGSSREHAVWALQQIGIEAVIAPSFGEIFETNALRNGLVPVQLGASAVDQLMAPSPGGRLIIDVVAETVTSSTGAVFNFALDPYRKHCLVNGIDDLDVIAGMEEAIAAYETRVRRERPWEQKVEGEVQE